MIIDIFLSLRKKVQYDDQKRSVDRKHEGVDTEKKEFLQVVEVHLITAAKVKQII